MRIGFATSEWAPKPDGTAQLGGTAWARCVLPMRALRVRGGHYLAIGADLRVRPDGAFALLGFDGQLHDDLDVVVTQRWMTPNAAPQIKAAVAAGQRIVQDIDDWYFGVDPRNDAFWTSHRRPGINRANWRRQGSDAAWVNQNNRDEYAKAIGASSSIVASTQYLADRLARHFGCPIHVIRNAIDCDRYTMHGPQAGDPLIGWSGGLSWRSGDLETLQGVLPGFLHRHGLRFCHLGDDPGRQRLTAGELLGIPEDDVEKRKLTNIEAYPDALVGIDVGLVPLNDVPFSHSKSNLKGLEYGACGIPFIAPAWQEEYQLLHRQGGGLLARKPKDWRGCLERLMDPAERDLLGKEARAAAEKNSWELRARDWEEALSGKTT